MESKSDIKELQHLSKCALMLHTTSSSISTHISRLLLEKCRGAVPGSVEHTLAQRFCGTCGCLVMPGTTSTMTHDRSKHMRTKHKTKGVATVTRRRKCHCCDRIETLPSFRKPSRGAMMAAQRSINPQIKVNLSHEESVKVPESTKEIKETVKAVDNDKNNNKSKERKKKRSKGLASLLAAKASSSTTKPSSSGLDLSDFMM